MSTAVVFEMPEDTNRYRDCAREGPQFVFLLEWTHFRSYDWSDLGIPEIVPKTDLFGVFNKSGAIA